MMEWQPIATAPKDGTLVIVVGGFIRWADGEKVRTDVLTEPVRAWWDEHGGHWYDGVGEYQYRPKYWLTLPAIPEDCCS